MLEKAFNEQGISIPTLQMCRTLSEGMLISVGMKTLIESCEAACVCEQGARRIANVCVTLSFPHMRTIFEIARVTVVISI